MLSQFTPGVIAFIQAFGLGLIVWTVGMSIISLATPYRELTLLREGNCAVGLMYGAKGLGLAWAIAGVVRVTAGPVDQVIWCCVAIIAQLAVHGMLSLLFKGAVQRSVTEAQINGATIFVALTQFGVGALNAAAMSS